MYAKFFEAAERIKRAQALAEKNEVLSSTDSQSHEDDGTQLKKSLLSESYNSCETSINKVCSHNSNSGEIEMNNLSKMMENSLYISKPLDRHIRTNIMFLRGKKLSQSTKMPPKILSETGNDGKDIEISPCVSSKIAIEPNTISTNTYDPKKVIKNSSNGFHSTLMDIRRKKLAPLNKETVGSNERESMHVSPTEGSKNEPDSPTEVIENGMHGAEQKMGDAKMVQMELRNGNLAESSYMPPKDPSDGEHIVQTEPKYVSSKRTSKYSLRESQSLNNWQKFNPLDGRSEATKFGGSPVVGRSKNNERGMDVSKTHDSQYNRERMRIDFNKLVQKRNPLVREITNTLEHPSLFDKLMDSVDDMNYIGGKNPVAVLNELIPDLEYHIEKSGSQHLPNFKVSVNIDGQNFCGVGKSKKTAKMNTAVVALKGIGSSTKTSTSTRTSIPKNVGSTYISGNRQNDTSTFISSNHLTSTSITNDHSTSSSVSIDQSPSISSDQAPSISSDQASSISSDQEKVLPGQALNAVSALNNLRKGLKYQFVATHEHPHLSNFTATVRVDQRKYRGFGRSKKLAKEDAARKALMCINGKRNNLHGALASSNPTETTENVPTSSSGRQHVAMSFPKRKPPTTSASRQHAAVKVSKEKQPFSVINELYSNPEVSWTGRDLTGSVSFTITLEGKKFTGIGWSQKLAKNDAAIQALHELMGVSPTYWENH